MGKERVMEKEFSEFEQWCHSIGMEDVRTDANDMVNVSVLKECWDFQQEEIKRLKEELESVKIDKAMLMAKLPENLAKIILGSLENMAENPTVKVDEERLKNAGIIK
jgi:hypothetical protein